jgi:hypothetical protein
MRIELLLSYYCQHCVCYGTFEVPERSGQRNLGFQAYVAGMVQVLRLVWRVWCRC